MAYEYGSAMVLYRKEEQGYGYLLEKNGWDDVSFLSGRSKNKEKFRDCAERIVKERLGLETKADPYFVYEAEYPVDEENGRSVFCFMARMPEGYEDEHRDLVFLTYGEAQNRLKDSQMKDVLKEVNDRLVNDMKICHMFEEGAGFDKRNLQLIRQYGSRCGDVRLYTWDEGDRSLYKCEKCGAYVLEQYSECHMPDSTYIDYFPVRDETHADEINRRYDGWKIEKKYPYKKIFETHSY